ncbi:MAG: hypothetical protein IMF09_13085 [Proteobacteria bacterium]|nr:hypothetical protein [Pseudomonadota bacterium]
MSKKTHYTFTILFLLFLLVMPLHAWAQGVGGCDASFVTLGGKAIEVSPTGIDDTDNIQCALDAVKSLPGGTPGVRLSAGDFFISSIVVENYKGYFQGETRDTTSVIVLNGSIDCAAMEAAGQTPSAIKFIRGEPIVRFMQIELGFESTSGPATVKRVGRGLSKPEAAQITSACAAGGMLENFLHFTGTSADDPACIHDVIFPVVDRVYMVGPGRETWVMNGISITPEGEYMNGCKNTLLGRALVNQSWIGYFTRGVVTSLRGAGDVDISKSVLWNNTVAVHITNANQNTMMTNNLVDTVDGGPDSFYAAGVFISTDRVDAPAENAVVVARNTFRLVSTGGEMMDAINFSNTGDGQQNLAATIRDNIFLLDASNVVGLWSRGVSSGTVADNRFEGSAWTGVSIFTENGMTDRGWTLTDNGDLRELDTGRADFQVGADVFGTFGGDGQFPTIWDAGADSIFLGVVLPSNNLLNTSTNSSKVALPQINDRDRSQKFLALLKKK